MRDYYVDSFVYEIFINYVTFIPFKRTVPQDLLLKISFDLYRYLTEEQLISECRIYNSIHRQKVREKIREYCK